LKLLDQFFVVFHTLLIIFNLFGWVFHKTRKANLITLLLTAFSWFFLGLFYGIGYCPLTEWHFMILEKLGNNNLPASYVKYIIHRLTGIDFNAQLIDTLTMAFFLVSLIISVVLNIRDFRKKRTQKL
ncbi:MAG TPA: DUF2784 domain-containing protein, partial [Bacteroidales bacterium]|nr:DUF2784 domain-containing protein [Bacteroidales bacterium]